MIIEDKDLRNKYYIFESRRRAGFLLGRYVGLEDFDVLYIIPAGGIPVGLGLLELEEFFESLAILFSKLRFFSCSRLTVSLKSQMVFTTVCAPA